MYVRTCVGILKLYSSREFQQCWNMIVKNLNGWVLHLTSIFLVPEWFGWFIWVSTLFNNSRLLDLHEMLWNSKNRKNSLGAACLKQILLLNRFSLSLNF